MAPPPIVNIRSALGRRIPGDGTIYIPHASKSPTIGECIYCGATADLTDEHSIPFALFGTAILKKASCHSCATKTQRVEQRLLRDTFGQVREYMKFPSRKARKSQRWSGTRPVIDTRTGLAAQRPLGEGVVVLIMAYPDYPPRALEAEPPGERHEKRAAAFIAVNPPTALMAEHFDDGWVTFNPTDIERCVAKIALCEAIRVVDAKVRDPMLTRFILEGEGDSSEFLGATMGHEITNKMHHVAHQKIVARNAAMGVMTTVELFSFLPSPTYQVLIRPPGGRVNFPSRN
jgi:hypothetical protein